MDSKHQIKLPPELIARCRKYGDQVVAIYAHGGNARSASVSSHGAEQDPYLQAIGRMGECAAAIYFEVDIERLSWDQRCDPGYEFAVHGKRIDVKSTIRGERLIWPYRKNHLLTENRFDILLLCKADPPWFNLKGWISRLDFIRLHRVEQTGGKLTAGTKYLLETLLIPMEYFHDSDASAYLEMLHGNPYAKGKFSIGR